ncbi:hypothetical protein P7H16_15675 [Paenibacillus larvae]|uniref:Uncharacterized protein n=2 Tax=Paenibacillus larvae TaxID=1464 RepID=A0A6C0QMV6_9BACL|nr:hypothetical protein [Paenibacillus larvae]MDT2248093.1 hypothetical protein [Paenibacillus larvae]MDT2259909.1 hypothetical protein [Paenibacillus larvae]MDT2264839.1 hypothetical protein [Paenibacillus larvae]MDT2275431.1 hypothetical protein [Paenibacillus larvae]MDT2288479.1 hypothetical protein [Paenibacillus larvae]
MKKYKTAFFLILFLNILTTIVINSTARKSEIFNEAITKGISLTHNQMTVVAMVSSIFTVFLLSVFLILARLLLILMFKIVFKKGDRKLINEIYFVSVGSKLIFSTVAIVTLFSATSWTFIFTSSCGIILYVIYLFANKQNTISGRTKKENIFQLITGCLLILLI